MSHAAAERQVLADALLEAGPDAPTLCGGWTAHDLAAHLVTREHRPDSAPGVRVPLFASWTEKVRRDYARRPFAELVETFRSGPPRWSWTGPPGVDAVVNLAEHFVHAEDVRRGSPGWEPRRLPLEREKALWKQVVTVGRLALRSSPVAVELVVPGGPRKVVGRRPEQVRLTGPASELLLYLFGRREQAQVEVTGSPSAVAAFQRTG